VLKALKKECYENQREKESYKWKVSLYFGDQLLVFDFVAIFLFLSCKCGPVKLISTYGRKTTPEGLAHFKSFAAITEISSMFRQVLHISISITPPFTVTLCSPDPACVNKSTWTETSPTTSSSRVVESGLL
jgi:hypothetical protein